MNLLNEIEASMPVDSWFVDDVPVWPVLRIYLLFALDSGTEQAAAGGATAPEPSRFSKAMRILERAMRAQRGQRRATRIDSANNERMDRRVDVAFLSHTTSRTFRLADGSWYDSFCQPIIELLKERTRSAFVFEFAPDNEYRLPRFGRSLLIESQLEMLRLRNEVVSARHVPLPAEAELRAFIRARAAFDPALALVRKRVRLIRLMATFFRPQLARLAPSLCFVSNYYNAPCMAFILACRELGIRSVDIQHGVQGELHGAYGRWTRLPNGGYSVLPSVFWCWSDDEAQTLREWTDATDGAHSVLVAGNLIVSKFLEAKGGLALGFDAAVEKLVAAANGNILFTLQPGRPLPPFVRTAIADSPPTWQWWLRLHPAMRADGARIADELRSSVPHARVLIEEASDLPLYALLRHMDVHVTELSSTVIEAEQFGVPSVLCSAAGAQLFASAVARGIALVADSHVGLLDAVERQRRRKPSLQRARLRVIDAEALDRFVNGDAAEARS